MENKTFNHLRIVPLAAESLGVRSMCTYVATSEAKILFDAGASVSPNRFGLPPHPMEYRALIESRRRILQAAKKAEVASLSHYHFDHHTPSFEDWVVNWTNGTETAQQIYRKKILLIKNPRNKINPSQRERARKFMETGAKAARKIVKADGKTFNLGKNTILKFSEPMFHGSENSPLGWVIMASVEYRGEKFMFAPDVQGPMSSQALNSILKEEPQMIMIGGPPFYLTGTRVSEDELSFGLRNLSELVRRIPVTILEHHTLRDEFWKLKTETVYNIASKLGHKVFTAAEFNGKKNKLLEFNRKKLYEKYSPSREFKEWMCIAPQYRRYIRPPI